MKIRVYTDGACSGNPGPGGWAACIMLEKNNKVISGGEEKTTNNRMELMAVVKAIKESIKIDGCERIEIFSDSAYVVNAVQKKWLDKWQKNCWKTSDKEDVKNKELWVKLLDEMKLCKKNNINLEFSKVKGHDGDYFNEMVDKVARDVVKKIKSKEV